MDHEMRVYVSNGTETHFTFNELLRLYQSWQLWILFCVVFLIMSTGHPVTLPQFESFGARLAFWIVALLIYLALSAPYGMCVDKVWSRVVGRPIPLILLSVPLVLMATVTAVLGLVLVFEPGRSVSALMSWQMHARNLFVAHVFETISLLWLIPAQRLRNQEHRTVTLAGQRLALSDIGRVQAAEHYLEVYMHDGRMELLRERMSTFLEQVTAQDGVQTHRSHWISRARAQALKGSVLMLDCGNSVPVARGRQKDVQDWMDRFPPPSGMSDAAVSPARQS